MSFLRDLPIKRKLLLLTLATCFAALALACAMLLSFQTVQFRGAFAAELKTLAAVVAQNCSAPLAFEDRKSAEEVLSSLRVKRNIGSVALLDGEGRVFASFGEAIPFSEGAVPGEVEFRGGHAWISVPVPMLDSKPGQLRLRAGYSEKQRELLGLYAGVLASVVASSLFVILLFSPVLQRIIGAPIVRLAEVAAAITEAEDYSARAPAGGKDEVGKLTRAFNRMLDRIEERDAALRESQQRYELAVTGSRDGIWDWEIKKDVVYYSPRWKEMIGYADHELPGGSEEWRTRLHPDDREATSSVLQEYLEGRREAYEAEYRLRHKDGTYRWVLARGAALRDGEGRPVRMSGSQTDITDRKEAQLALQASEERFRSLAHGALDAIVSTSEAGEIVSWNPAAQRLFGGSEKERVGTPFRLILTAQAQREHEVLVETLKLEHSTAGRTVELLGMNPKGAEFPIELSIARWEAGGRSQYTAVIRDISQRKEAESELARLNGELVAASRQAGMAEIATGVLHNVGNVLNSVNVSAALILDALRRFKAPIPGKIAELIRANGENLDYFLTRHPKGRQLPEFLAALGRQMVEEQESVLAEVQRLQEGVQHIKQIVSMQNSYAKVSGVLELISLQSIVEDALNLSANSLARHKIEVARKYEKAPRVLTDRHKVLQILINLINNAKHALESRAIDRRIEIAIGTADGRARLEVADNGVGIAAENLTRIFRHGFTTKRGGHGFGLHSGANSARELGGSLAARSDGPGLGAVFALELPLAPEAGADPAAKKAVSNTQSS